MNNESALEVLSASLSSLYDRLVTFLPVLLLAVLVLVFGWAFAILLGRLVGRILRVIRIDELADRLGLERLSERVGRKLTVSGFGNWIVKWFFLVAVFVAAADILGLEQVGEFLFGSVLPYIANVVVAVAILVIGVVAADFLQGLVKHTLQASKLGSFDMVVTITRWAVLIFAFLAALSQLRVASDFIQDLFRAVVAMLAIAGGIAFGLGGKDHAKAVLDHISKDLRK